MPIGCIVIGASAGGLEVLKQLFSRLPADLPVPVFVAMHVAAYHHSYLPEILTKIGPLPAVHPEDGEEIQNGMVYVAPPDHHLLIDDGYVAVKKGPKENGFRPSIDALFRSAAYSHGPGTIGIVLSGALHDGASGLWSIKRLGGIAIVQDPFEAEYASMPRSALEYVEADYKVRSTEIGQLLARLVQEQSVEEVRMGPNKEKGVEQRIATEVQIAAGSNVSQKNILELGELTPFACPECHGALVRIKEGKLSRYRCHTGHGSMRMHCWKASCNPPGKRSGRLHAGFRRDKCCSSIWLSICRMPGNRREPSRYSRKPATWEDAPLALQRQRVSMRA